MAEIYAELIRGKETPKESRSPKTYMKNPHLNTSIMVPQFLLEDERSWGRKITLKGRTLKLTFDFTTERTVAIKP